MTNVMIEEWKKFPHLVLLYASVAFASAVGFFLLHEGIGLVRFVYDGMSFLQEGFTFRIFLLDVLSIFIFVVWFWLLITIFSDLFRRLDISGWGKAIWVIGLIVFPFITLLAYLIFQSRGMAERNMEQAQQARDDLRRVVGFSVADEIVKLDQLKKAGSISDAEFARLRAPLIGSPLMR